MQKFLRLFVLMALFALPFASNAQNSWTVADSTAVHASVPLDFYNCDGSGVREAQMLYPASLLTSMNGSTLGSITFYHQSTATKTLSTSTWYILIGETSETDLSSGFSTVALDTVYEGNLVVNNGVFSFDFTTPYTYNGGNLIVEILTNGASGNWFGNSGQGCYGKDGIGSTYSSMSTPNYTAFLPKTTFTEAPSCYPVTGLAINEALTTSTSLTLTWNDANNTGATYSVYSLTPTDTTLIEDYISTTSYTVYNLTANTNYVFGVIADCGTGDLSEMTIVSGRTACGLLTMPWSENFDNWTAKSDCWSFLSGAYNGGAGTPSTSSSAWSLNSSYGDNINISGNALTMNVFSTNRYWAVTPAIVITSDNANLSVDVAVADWSSATPAYDANDTLAFAISTDNGTTFTNLRVLDNTEINALNGTYTTLYIPVANHNGDTVRFAIFAGSSASGGDNRIAIDNVTVGEAPSCMPVTGLTVSNITSTEATLTWHGDADGYTIYDMSDTTVYEYANDTTVTLYALDAMTAYTFGVAANCGTDESDIVTISFNTACTAVTIPYTEDFEASSNTVACWTTDGPGSWTIGTGDYSSSTGAFSGSTNAKIQHSSTGNVTKLISPALDLDGANGVQLVYAHIQRSWSGDQDEMRVYYRTSDTTAWIQAAEYTNEISSWTVDNVLLPATTYQVAFEMTDGYGYGVAIDSVVFNPIMGDYCAPVAALTVDSVSTTSVSLSWMSDANDYTIIDMADNSVVATSTVNNVTISGLTAGTVYNFGVVVDCGSTTSDTVTITAMTQCESTCSITINGADSYGDGWNGNAINVMQAGVLVGTFTLTTGASNTETFTVCSGIPVSFVWVMGSYPSETSFEIVDGGNVTAISIADGSTLTNGQTITTINDPCPSCATPVVSVDALTETSVTISWTGNATSYSIYNGSTYVANATANTYTFSGLTAGTAYTFGVVALCAADDSSAMATVNATTEFDCSDITTLPYNYGFEPGLGCWTTVNGSADGVAWFTTDCGGLGVTPHSGSQVASSWSWNSTSMHANAWLISPKFVLPTVAAGDSLTFSWWEVANANYADSYSVKISTTTADTTAFTITARPSTAAAGSWTQQSIDLTAYAGQSVYVAFHHVDYDMNYLLIDDIELYQGAYVPPAPDTLTVTVATMDATMGTTNPAPGTYQYAETETVSLSAIANTGYHFTGWAYTADGINYDTVDENYISLSFPASLFMSTGSVTFTALFEAGNPDSTTVTYAVNDATMGTTVPAPGTYTAYVGSTVQAEAIANNGYEVAGWVLGIYDAQNTALQEDTLYAFDEDFANPMNFGTVPQSFADNGYTITVTALFTEDTVEPQEFTLITAVNDATMGTITPAPGTHTYVAGDSILFGFTAAEGYTIGSVDMTMSIMGETIMDTTLPALYAIAMAQEPLYADDFLGMTMSLTVNFIADTNSGSDVFTLITAVNDATMGTMTPAPGTHTYNAGDVVNFTVTANEGYAFESATMSISYMGTTVQEETVYDLEFTTEPLEIDEEMIGFTMTFTVNFKSTQGIENANEVNVNAYTKDGNIILNGAEGREVYLFDINGRMLNHTTTAAETEVYSVPASGVYLIKVDGVQTKRVVVIR